MSEKTGKKTGTMRSPRSGAECPTGAHAANTGGKKGRSGRPPKRFKEFASELVQDGQLQNAVKQAALSGDIAAVKLLVAHAEGLPTRTVRIEGSDDVRRAFAVVQRTIGETLDAETADRLSRAIQLQLVKEGFE